MAQLLIPPPPENARLSQILPTVKCSSCNLPVPLSELGDHVCPPAPIVKPPMSPRSTASILSEKYHSLVSRPSTPVSQSPSHSHSPSKPSISNPPARQSTSVTPLRINSPKPPQAQPQRSRSSSTVSSLNVRDPHARPDRTPSPLSREAASSQPKVAFPSSPGPTSPQRIPRVPSPLATQPPQSAAPLRVPTPSNPGKVKGPQTTTSPAFRGNAEPTSRPPSRSGPTLPSNPARRSRAPSIASLKHGPRPTRSPTLSSPTPSVPPLQPGRNSSTAPLSLPTSRQRPTTNNGALPPIDTSPAVIYSTGSRTGPSQPNFDPHLRSPSAPGVPFSPYGTMSPAVRSGMSPMQGPFSPMVEMDTKIGGEAGMAGVGRRGFAAAARAAMFTLGTSSPSMSRPINDGMSPRIPTGPNSADDRAMLASMNAVHGMDGRRPNAPRFLDINSAQNYGKDTLYIIFHFNMMCSTINLSECQYTPVIAELGVLPFTSLTTLCNT